RHGGRARRLGRNAPRYRTWLRRQQRPAGRPLLHHPRTEDQLRPAAQARGGRSALRGLRHSRGESHRDRRGARRRRRRKNLRPRDDHVHARRADSREITPMSDFLRYDIQDRVAVLTIDNPPVNALAQGVWEAVDEAVARAGIDPAADAIVLIGAGTTFVAGADINVFKILKTREQSLERSARTHALLKRLEDVGKPLVAAIHGNALGGGLELAQACHYRVATADAKVGQPEVLLGIIPGAGGTQRLPRLCGAELAAEMSTAGKPVGAAKAKAAGIVDAIVDGDLLHGAMAFAKAKADAHAIRKTRDITIDVEAARGGV